MLDAGALIALERGLPTVRGYVLLADRGKLSLATSAAVVAQAWRGGARQARLARFLSSDLIDEVPLDFDAGRRIGVLGASVNAKDVVDGHVALIAMDRDAIVVTSDPDDIARWGVPGEKLVRC